MACLAAITMMAQGYGTFYNSKYDADLPPGTVVYIVTGVNNGKLTYQKIADGSDSNNKSVPAGTAILLCPSSENTGDVNPNFTTNLLHGSDVATTTTGGALYYKLTFSNNNDNFNKQAADVNGDGQINMADYIGVAHLLLYGTIEKPKN